MFSLCGRVCENIKCTVCTHYMPVNSAGVEPPILLLLRRGVVCY